MRGYDLWLKQPMVRMQLGRGLTTIGITATAAAAARTTIVGRCWL